MNSTSTTLMPRKMNKKWYRPIRLVTSVYKIIIEVLSLHFSEVLDDTLASNQSAFMRGRQILDASVITNEIVEYMARAKRKGLVLKLDL